MIFFLLKKTAYDFFDNFFGILILNLSIISIFSLNFFLLKILPDNLFFIPLFLLFFLIVISFLIFISYLNGSMNFSLIKIILSGLYISIINSFIVFFGMYSIDFYFKSGNIFFNAFGFLLIWIISIWFIGLILYFPYLHKNNYDNKKTIKKIFYIFFDNIFLTIFISLIFVIFCLSTIFLILGFGVALIFIDNALKIILKKYDFIIENKSKKIDWNAILKEENEFLKERKRNRTKLIFKI